MSIFKSQKRFPLGDMLESVRTDWWKATYYFARVKGTKFFC